MSDYDDTGMPLDPPDEHECENDDCVAARTEIARLRARLSELMDKHERCLCAFCRRPLPARPMPYGNGLMYCDIWCRIWHVAREQRARADRPVADTVEF
jgi:hypothetical protein